MTRMEQLKEFLRKLSDGGIALAFSGGADSSFLLAALKELRDERPFPLKALTMQTVFQEEEELADARGTAAGLGMDLEVFRCDPLQLPEIRNNPPDRCYRCKHFIFSRFLDYCREHGLGILLDGTNADDVHVYRPGRQALRELGVVSPLAELGFTKAEIRLLAAERGLKFASKPSMPCLATRFEYGTELTPELLEKTAAGEALLRNLLPENTDIRLRVQGKIARIEVTPSAMDVVLANRKTVSAGLRELGFEFITLDLEGFRSGCYDKTREEQI